MILDCSVTLFCFQDFVFFPTKNNRPMKTAQLNASDNKKAVTQLHTLRFDAILSITRKRSPKIKHGPTNPQMKNPKHQAVLQETGIIYDSPLLPTQVVQMRQERLAKEKSTKAAAAVAAAGAQSAGQTASAGATVQAVANAVRNDYIFAMYENCVVHIVCE